MELIIVLLLMCAAMATVITSIPTNLRRPGAYHEFIHTQAGRGLVALDKRVLLIGVKSAAGTATVAQPTQAFDEADGETKAGRGSPLDLMLKKAFRQARKSNAMPEIWFVAVAAPGGVAAVQTLTVTGTATASGNIVIRIAGRPGVVGVSSGDAQNTVAAAINTAINAMLRDLPLTSSVATNVVTCTNVATGTHGNDVFYEVVQSVAGTTVTPAQSVAGTGAIDITASLDVSLDKDYEFLATHSHVANDVSDYIAHTTVAWGFQEKKYRFGVIGERGTLSTANALATGGNDKTVIVVGYEDCPNTPGEIATAFAVAAACSPRPNSNLDGIELDLYPPPSASAFTAAEVESALASGMTPLSPTFNGSGTKIERAVTTLTTVNAAPFEPLRDLQYPRTAAFMAKQEDIAYATRFQQETIDGDGELLKRVRDMVIELHRSAELNKILRNVDDYLPQIIVEEAASPAGRLLVQDAFKVAGPLHQAAFVHVHYL